MCCGGCRVGFSPAGPLLSLVVRAKASPRRVLLNRHLVVVVVVVATASGTRQLLFRRRAHPKRFFSASIPACISFVDPVYVYAYAYVLCAGLRARTTDMHACGRREPYTAATCGWRNPLRKRIVLCRTDVAAAAAATEIKSDVTQRAHARTRRNLLLGACKCRIGHDDAGSRRDVGVAVCV